LFHFAVCGAAPSAQLLRRFNDARLEGIVNIINVDQHTPKVEDGPTVTRRLELPTDFLHRLDSKVQPVEGTNTNAVNWLIDILFGRTYVARDLTVVAEKVSAFMRQLRSEGVDCPGWLKPIQFTNMQGEIYSPFAGTFKLPGYRLTGQTDRLNLRRMFQETRQEVNVGKPEAIRQHQASAGRRMARHETHRQACQQLKRDLETNKSDIVRLLNQLKQLKQVGVDLRSDWIKCQDRINLINDQQRLLRSCVDSLDHAIVHPGDNQRPNDEDSAEYRAAKDRYAATLRQIGVTKRKAVDHERESLDVSQPIVGPEEVARLDRDYQAANAAYEQSLDLLKRWNVELGRLEARKLEVARDIDYIAATIKRLKNCTRQMSEIILV
jgi:hypothetical protein